MLGVCYRYGQGTADQDHNKALEFYTKSAEQGNEAGTKRRERQGWATETTHLPTHPHTHTQHTTNTPPQKIYFFFFFNIFYFFL
jgi:TPR repeat protein